MPILGLAPGELMKVFVIPIPFCLAKLGVPGDEGVGVPAGALMGVPADVPVGMPVGGVPVSMPVGVPVGVPMK